MDELKTAFASCGVDKSILRLFVTVTWLDLGFFEFKLHKISCDLLNFICDVG